jgi:CBS-domain-containing membrane protein
MRPTLKSLQPGRTSRRLRPRVGLRGEFILVLLPTATVLGVLGLVEVFSRQRLLFASLAASAFLIYLEPGHGTNSMRTLALAQLSAAGLGWLAYTVLGPGYLSGGSAMVITIALMVALDAVHPPAVATSLSFALRARDEKNLVLFALAVGITVVLVVLERATLWLLARLAGEPPSE